MSHRQRGFSLVEILIVVAVLGIIAGIAIPSFLGSRAQARYIGDARSNAQIIQMSLEQFKADNGLYPPAKDYTWAQGVPPAGNPLPSVAFRDGTKLDFKLTVNADRLSYTIEVTDPRQANKKIYKVDQTGQIVP